MMPRLSIRRGLDVALVLIIATMLVVPARSARAQEADTTKGKWSFTGELASVLVGGNSQSTTFGVGAQLQYERRRSVFKAEAASIFTESKLRNRWAEGTAASFTEKDSTSTQRTAETYYARGRYDYNVSERFFLFGGVDWLRNTFAGIDSRVLLAGGAGNTWKDNEKVRFKTDYSFTYTFQEDVVENPFIKNNFPGVRLGYDFWIQVSSSAEFESTLLADLNLDNTDDIRLDWYNALPISISSKLAFKPSLRLLWRNQPSLTTVPLLDGSGAQIGEVSVPLQKLDSFFKISLVFKV